MDLVRFRAGSYFEVELESFLVAVEHAVYARIQPGITNTPIGWDIGLADGAVEIVVPLGERIEGEGLRLRIRARKVQRSAQHRQAGPVQQIVMRVPACHKSNRLRSLSAIRFKGQRTVQESGRNRVAGSMRQKAEENKSGSAGHDPSSGSRSSMLMIIIIIQDAPIWHR